MSCFKTRWLTVLPFRVLTSSSSGLTQSNRFFQCLLETRFEDAGFCLFQGDLDPRVLISYFPELRRALLDGDPTVEVFSGIAECMPPYDSIDDISTSPLLLRPFPALPHPRLAPASSQSQ